ncbi:putative leucine-rich repeat-containing protein DDB_G0290503 isoform X1 [Argopecten irradians]|uniref:putative leucine-rich repeat-containing protein DDB_G0290503 isoform X1 n=1 Tax=Argopecten irradians TaxID=31199 RepID=UPI00371CE699
MDSGKKNAVINWVNALLPDKNISTLQDLTSGQVFLGLMKLSEKYEVAAKSHKECFTVIKEYIEEHYFTKLDCDSSPIDIHIAEADSPATDSLTKEWELAKILYALFGAFVQDKNKQTFVNAALNLPQDEQLEIMEILEPIVASQDLTTRLPPDFADILKKKREPESTFHKDADLFFKLVSQNKGIVTSTPTVDQSFNFPTGSNGTPLTPVPPHLARGLGPHEISSPMRMLTLASPGPLTPLSALMQSPQVAQKMLLREKEKEIRKLEMVVASERHFKDNLEMDIKEKCQQLGQKDRRILELETALKGQRNITDVYDELELVKQERDNLQKEASSAHLKHTELQDFKEHCKFLERENSAKAAEVESLSSQLLALEALKKSHEEYRSKCHHQKLQIAEIESALDHCKYESQQAKQKVAELEESRVSLRQQLDEIRTEKSEMEEMMAISAIDGHNKNGESMGIILETRNKELEDQLAELTESWYDPVSYKRLEKELVDVTETKRIFEAKFMETHQRLLKKDDDMEQLQQALVSSKNNVDDLELNLSEMTNKLSALETERAILRSKECELTTLLNTASSEKQSAEEEVVCLRTKLSHAQTEIQLLTMEAEGQKLATEERRKTLAASVDFAKSEQKSIEQKLKLEQTAWQTKVDSLHSQIQQQRDESVKVEADLKSKLKASQNSLKQLEIRMENELWVKDNSVKCLKEEMASLKEEICETETRLQEEVNTLKEVKGSLEGQLARQTSSVEQLQVEITSSKNSARSETEELVDTISKLESECEECKREMDRMRIEFDGKVQGLEMTANRQQAKWSEKESGLKHQVVQKEQLCVDLSQSLEKSEAEVTTLKENLALETTTRSDLEQQLRSIEKDLDKEKQLSCTLKKDIDVQKSVISDLKTSLAQSSSELSHLTECLDEQHMELSKVSEIKQCLEKKLKESKSELQNIQKEYANEMKCISEELEKHRTESAQTQSTLTRDLSKSQKECEGVHKQLEQLKEQFQVSVSKGTTLDSRLTDLTRQIQTRNSENEALTKEVSNLQEQIDELNGQVVLVTKVAETKQVSNDQLVQENKALSEEVQQLSSRISNVMEEQKTISQEKSDKITSLEAAILEKDNDVCNLKKVNSELNSRVSEFSEKASDLESVIREKDNEISSLSDCISERDVEISNLMGDKQDLSINITRLSSEKESLQGWCNEQCEKISCLDKQLSDLTTKTSLLEEVLGDKSGQISSLELLVSKHSQENEQLRKEKDNNHGEIESLKAQVAEKTQDMETIHVKCEQLGSESQIQKEELKTALCDNGVLTEQLELVTAKFEASTVDLKSELEKVSCENKHLTDSLACMTEKYESSVRDLNSEQVKSATDNGVWVEKCETVKTKYESSISELNCKLEKATNDSVALSERLQSETAKYETSISDLTLEKEKALSDLAVLTERLESSQTKYERTISNLSSQLEKASSENDGLSKKLKLVTEEYETSISEMKGQMKADCDAFIKSHEEKMQDFLKDMTSTNQELKEAGEKRRSLEQTILKLNQQLMIERDSNDKVILEAKVVQIESELKEKTELLEQVRASCQHTVKESEQYWRSQLCQLESEYHKATEEHTQECRDELARQDQNFQIRLQAIVHEKEMTAATDKALLQNRITYMEKKLEKKQNELTDLEKKHQAENSAMLEKVKSDYQNKMDKIQDLLTSETENQKELANRLHEQQARCDELEKGMKEMKQSCDISMANQTTSHNEELNNLRQEFKSKLSDFQKESTQLLQQEQSRTAAAKSQCSDLSSKLDEATNEITKFKKQVTNMKENAALNLQQWQLKLAEVKGSREAEEEELRTELSRLQEHCSNTDEDLRQLNERIKTMESTEAKLQQTIDNYRIHYNKKKEVIDLLKKETDFNVTVAKKFEKKSTDLSKEVKRLQGLLETGQSNQHGLQDKLEKEKVNNTTLCKQVVELKAELKSSKRQIDTLRKQLDITSNQFIGDNKDFVQNCLNRKEDDLPNQPHSSSEEEAPLRRSSRLLSANLDSSMMSTDSGRSIASLPRGTANLFAMEDEPADMEWKRFSELQRRNTLQLPHNRTTYPVEMQQYSENSVRESLAFSTALPHGLKRKQESSSDEGESSKQQPRHGIAYQKPGPPTPGNSTSVRRNSKGTPRYNLRSPRTPIGNTRSKRTPKRSVNEENEPTSLRKSAKKWLNNTAFNIINTPNKKFRGNSATKSASKGSRKPLGNKNFLQTGV